MRALEAFNKALVGILLFLVGLQASLLFVMKNMRDEAKVKLVENQTTTDLKCGDSPFAPQNYWDPLARLHNGRTPCNGWSCEKSGLTWQEGNNAKNLHIVSVKMAPPMRWKEQDVGGVVRVRVPASDKPQILALSSESMHEWRLVVDKNAKLEKVIVATPTIVWIDGVPEKAKTEYLPKEKMCSYPYSWEEAHNPDNEFRLFVGALKKITGVLPTSFQGAVVGRDFVIPKSGDFVRREIASIGEEKSVLDIKNNVLWERQGDRVAARQAVIDQTSIILPDKTDAVSGIFVLRKSRLHVWNAERKKYEVVIVPMTLPALNSLTAIGLQDPNIPHRVFVFNDAEGGEIYSYDHENKKWLLVQSGIPAVLRALYYNLDNQKLYGLASRGQSFTDVFIFSPNEKTMDKKPIANAIAFDSLRWKWEFLKKAESFHIVLYTPLDPDGDVRSLHF